MNGKILLCMLIILLLGCSQQQKNRDLTLHTYKVYVDGIIVKHEAYKDGSYFKTDTIQALNDSEAYDKGSIELLKKRMVYDVEKATNEHFKKTNLTLPDTGLMFSVLNDKGDDLKKLLPKEITEKIEKDFLSNLARLRHDTKIEMDYKELHPEANNK